MELIVWKKGVQDIWYLCDKCKKRVTEDEGLWVVRDGAFCKQCARIKRRRANG
jgi:hypothetical protein